MQLFTTQGAEEGYAQRRMARTQTPSLTTWQEHYAAQLRAPHGWWSVTSLDWLNPGDNVAGNDPAQAILLPERTGANVARITVHDDHAILTPTGETPLFVAGKELTAPRTIESDTEVTVGREEPPIIMSVVKRFGRFGVRTYDPAEAAKRAETEHVAWFPESTDWQVPARYHAAAAGETVNILNVIGDEMTIPVVGRLTFDVNGEPVTLIAVAGSNDSLFINFTDETNRVTTYGGGRFLSIPRPETANCVIDFNYAHHPPCAHTAYATCPVPPEGNHIPASVTAGECLERE